MVEDPEFVERMGHALAEAGVPRLPARVFAALLVDDDGTMTAAELADAVRSSPASISTAVRYLVQVDLVRREREPGSRRDLVVVDEDAWHRATLSAETRYAALRTTLDDSIARLPAGSPSRQRLTLSRAFFEFLDVELQDVARRWQEKRSQLEG